jgi:hypothetical protein
MHTLLRAVENADALLCPTRAMLVAMAHLTREQQEALEVYGFDLMAQVEAMLRHIREYQRALQRFRGTLPRQQSNDPTQTPIAVMSDHVRGLRAALQEFNNCLTEVEERTVHREKGEKPTRTVAGVVRSGPATSRNTSKRSPRRGDGSRS